jgi:hypothetical protein
MHVLGSFVKNQMAVAVGSFCSISLVFMHVFVPVPYCFYYYGLITRIYREFKKQTPQKNQ